TLMATKKLNGMNETSVKGACPAHSGGPHTPLRRQFRQESGSHGPMRARTLGLSVLIVVVMKMVVMLLVLMLMYLMRVQLVGRFEGLGSRGKPIEPRGSISGRRRHRIQPSSATIVRSRRRQRRRHLVEAHLGILNVIINPWVVPRQEGK
ncbi:hypothetical protein PanWU01x14_047200, partial [Parasponia andersonii]